MGYLLIAYPDFTPDDFEMIQRHRKAHDVFYNIVEPHITLVFAVHDISEREFVNDITQQTKQAEKISLSLRYATVHKDSFSDYFHQFLIVDEGYNTIVKLHDRLYSGILKQNLRDDIGYMPHVTIGNAKDPHQSQQSCDVWNTTAPRITGTISTVTAVHFAQNKLTKLVAIPLG